MSVNALAETVVNDKLLRDWALPQPGGEGDKEERGRVLIVAGSRQMPGAAWLAATASLRAGAGKLSIATSQSVAAGLALNLPESLVHGLPESSSGGLLEEGVTVLAEALASADAVLLGPGWMDEKASLRFAQAVLMHKGLKARVVLDAYAMGAVTQSPTAAIAIVITPHAGEMAHLFGVSKEHVLHNAKSVALEAARRWNCIVALKGATTFIAAPDGRLWRHAIENAGLGTSGSGDALAGVIAGLAARGAALEQAAIWGVALHARAGRALAARTGPLGYLAGELLAEIPALMHKVAAA